jgi:hypothetical protein
MFIWVHEGQVFCGIFIFLLDTLWRREYDEEVMKSQWHTFKNLVRTISLIIEGRFQLVPVKVKVQK